MCSSAVLLAAFFCVHQRHYFKPGAGQRFAQGWVVLEGLGVDHHHVHDFAGNLAGIEYFAHAWLGLDVREHRVPGGDGLDLVGVEGGRDISVGGVDDFQVFLGEAYRIQGTGQQVMGHRQFHQIDVHALEVGDFLAFALEDDAVVAVGEVADDQRGAVHATGGGNGQGVHVGHGAAVELTGGVLVDGFDVIVELHDIDLDAVFFCPFIDDALATGVFPGHPAGVNGPADAEVVFLGGGG
nr:hypothetical protein GCM10020185_12830 [Pseudomonas brassicacearum subsp. brassicacearum]